MTSARRPVATYLLMVAIPAAAVLVLVRHLGSAGATLNTGGGSADGVARLLLSVAVIVLTAYGLGLLVSRFGQPRVVGEILGGIAIGPLALGLISPQVQAALVPADLIPHLAMFSQVGVTLFMFVIGAELKVEKVRGRGGVVLCAAHAGIVVPFALGAGIGLMLYERLASGSVARLPFVLFFGLALSITAFPVLARILQERRLEGTELGSVALATAAVADVTAWCLLAVVIAVVRDDAGHAYTTIAWLVAFGGGMVVIVRPLLRRLWVWLERRRSGHGVALPLILAGILLSGYATEKIGVHAIFGAFLFGAILPKRSPALRRLIEETDRFAVSFLLPMFFAQVGLSTNLAGLGADHLAWWYALLILAAGIIGKWAGTTVTCLSIGQGWRESGALGVLMNCRGLTELVVLDIGLRLHIIDGRVFTILVLMALVTTIVTAPALKLFLRDAAPNTKGTCGGLRVER